MDVLLYEIILRELNQESYHSGLTKSPKQIKQNGLLPHFKESIATRVFSASCVASLVGTRHLQEQKKLI